MKEHVKVTATFQVEREREREAERGREGEGRREWQGQEEGWERAGGGGSWETDRAENYVNTRQHDTPYSTTPKQNNTGRKKYKT